MNGAKPAHTILVTEDTVLAPTTEIESEIGLIMSKLRLLDREEELVSLGKDRKERTIRARQAEEKRKTAFVQIDVKPTGIGKYLCDEVVLSGAEASHGIEEPILSTSRQSPKMILSTSKSDIIGDCCWLTCVVFADS